jgi:hypothetical protein
MAVRIVVEVSEDIQSVAEVLLDLSSLSLEDLARIAPTIGATVKP